MALTHERYLYPVVLIVNKLVDSIWFLSVALNQQAFTGG